jgi:CelD/BcsL family acetyltransferase involved in cellulose biosynthesis
MNADMEVRVTSDEIVVKPVPLSDTAFWDEVAIHPAVSLFSSPLWTRAVAETYGFTPWVSARMVRGQMTDALLFTPISDLRGERLICGPFCDYCDPLADDATSWHDLVAPLLARRVPIILRCLSSDLPGEDSAFRENGRTAWHCVDLTRPEDALWQGFEGSARQNVRKAQRSGVVVREGRSLEDVRIFYDMHCSVRKNKYRLLPQPFAFFERIHACFAPKDRLTVLLAEVDGQAVAGIFFLEWSGTLYYKFNASIARERCPNDLLVWEGIRMGRRRGLSRLDFGCSDYEQPGLLRYKRKFATEERVIRRFRWEPRAYADARAAEANALLGRMTDLLTDPAVPDDITRRAGDVFYGLFC